MSEAANMSEKHDRLSPGTSLVDSAVKRIDMAFNYKVVMVKKHGASASPTWEEVQAFENTWAAYQTHIRLGTNSGQAGRLDIAISEYLQAIKIFDGDVAYAYLGGCLVRLNRFDEAVLMLNEAIARNPNSAVSFYNRIIANRNLGNMRAVVSDFDQLEVLDPTLASRVRKR